MGIEIHTLIDFVRIIVGALRNCRHAHSTTAALVAGPLSNLLAVVGTYHGSRPSLAVRADQHKIFENKIKRCVRCHKKCERYLSTEWTLGQFKTIGTA